MSTRKAQAGKVYVKGGWVERVPTIPFEDGVEAVVRFARECLRKNIDLQHQVLDLQLPRKGPADDSE